ncbi:hypothetical protein EPA93_07510 [Ktedonosporobacter rubrisoli]|uniref:Uncharacterized protein n=1 Tax=Ktedonosporobacter rubrisoli TaxID=2509675 RepID=A0A4P6JLJ0_KTERU|nr:hypothetical protein [Ktedonosporobacter rubrisoli]QBD75862.1 hypothetical protein EPA93_07510 [Ktedonosporobacter rubrisoli]
MSEDKLYKLALRLADKPRKSELKEPQILIGSLPELQIPVPIPAGSELLGTVIYGPRALEILLDVPLAAQEALAFYRRELVAESWQTREDELPKRGGFSHSTPSSFINEGFSHNSGLVLDVHVGREVKGVSHVSLNLGERAPSQRRRRNPMHDEMFRLLPSLVPPAGASQSGSGGSFGSDQVSTRATLELQEEAQLADLLKHYTDQLERAGWKRLDGELLVHTAWTAWNFQDKESEEWFATFYMFRIPVEKRRYQLELSAEVKDIDSRNPGWSTSTWRA